MNRALITIAACLLAASAQAQTASQPLNLKLPPVSQLPPSDLPAASSTSATKPGSAAPGVYYGDTSGHVEADDTVAHRTTDCDDATYNKPETHGSVGMGVVSGSHMGSGTWNSGNVNITQRMGSCDHPTGSIGVSIGVSRFNGRGF